MGWKIEMREDQTG